MTEQEYNQLDQAIENWQKKKDVYNNGAKNYGMPPNHNVPQNYVREQNKVFGISPFVYFLIFGVLFAYFFFIKKDAIPSVSDSNPTENSTGVGEITTNQKYQSYNYYGNNVTEYLEFTTDRSILYSTSTRPNPIKMLVTKGDKPDELTLRFPDDSGDNQRYRMKVSNDKLFISIPNGKEQIYTPKIEEVAETNTEGNSKWAGNYESLFNTAASGPSNMIITISNNNKAVCKYSSRSGATNINATVSILDNDKALLIFEDGKSDGYGDIQIDKDLKQGGLVAKLQKNSAGFSANDGIVGNRTFKKVVKYTE